MRDPTMSVSMPRAASSRWLACAGALLAAGAVALSAYAAHAAVGDARASLQSAAVFAFGHGVALAALARVPRGRLGSAALLALLCGTLLFCGGLCAAHFLDVRARTAPFGGTLLILAWLTYAIDAARGGRGN